MAATEGDIASLKAQLEAGRTRRSNLLQYEGVAKTVNALPDRGELRKRQREAEGEAAEAAATAATLEAQLAARREQFTLLLATIADLQSQFTLEGAAEAQAAAGAGAGEGEGGEEGDVDLT